jgi:uncharacterized protein (TIGR02722 family)
MGLLRAAVLFVVSLGFLAGCASVQRIDPETVTDLSGYWNDTDSRLVAEEMITDVLRRPWLSDFTSKHGKKPTVIVGGIANRSDEHIPTQAFTKNLERELINAGRVSFVADKGERVDVREEREDQQVNANAETMKRMRNEKGSDYMLKGVITTINDAKGKDAVRFYQINLELIDMESNEKVWLGEKQIKKKVTRSDVRG